MSADPAAAFWESYLSTRPGSDDALESLALIKDLSKPKKKRKKKAPKSTGSRRAMRVIDHGTRFGSLTVMEEMPSSDGPRRFVCRCDCGNMCSKQMGELNGLANLRKIACSDCGAKKVRKIFKGAR